MHTQGGMAGLSWRGLQHAVTVTHPSIHLARRWRRDTATATAKNDFPYDSRPPSWICKKNSCLTRDQSKFATVYQISSKSVDTQLRYCAKTIFEMRPSAILNFWNLLFRSRDPKVLSVMLNEAKTSRPRPRPWGRGQNHEVESRDRGHL